MRNMSNLINFRNIKNRLCKITNDDSIYIPVIDESENTNYMEVPDYFYNINDFNLDSYTDYIGNNHREYNNYLGSNSRIKFKSDIYRFDLFILHSIAPSLSVINSIPFYRIIGIDERIRTNSKYITIKNSIDYFILIELILLFLSKENIIFAYFNIGKLLNSIIIKTHDIANLIDHTFEIPSEDAITRMADSKDNKKLFLIYLIKFKDVLYSKLFNTLDNLENIIDIDCETWPVNTYAIEDISLNPKNSYLDIRVYTGVAE